MVNGQDQPISLWGQVLDESTLLPNKNDHFTFDFNRGFISNENGEFGIEIYKDSILVKVSCIGYTSEKLGLYKNQPNRILLRHLWTLLRPIGNCICPFLEFDNLQMLIKKQSLTL